VKNKNGMRMRRGGGEGKERKRIKNEEEGCETEIFFRDVFHEKKK
jgi:hypothetical protein